MKKESKKRYKALLFDLDGTLIDSLEYHFLSFKDMLLEHNIRANDPYLRRLIGLPTEGILKALRKKYGFNKNIEDLREERRYHYFKFIGTKNIVFPGIKRLLNDLRLKYKIAIVTGSSYTVFKHSSDIDFQQLFDSVVTINDVRSGKGKPNPDQLILAAKKLKVKKEECIMIGDSIYDMIAAKRAGMLGIGVETGFTKKSDLIKAGADKVIKSVVKIKPAL